MDHLISDCFEKYDFSTFQNRFDWSHTTSTSIFRCVWMSVKKRRDCNYSYMSWKIRFFIDTQTCEINRHGFGKFRSHTFQQIHLLSDLIKLLKWFYVIQYSMKFCKIWIFIKCKYKNHLINLSGSLNRFDFRKVWCLNFPKPYRLSS